MKTHQRIRLTRGKVALVDTRDYAGLDEWTWQAQLVRQGNQADFWYATRKDPQKAKGTIYMHRQILSVIDGRILVDHIDGNGLNNQRSNLRPSTRQENAQNMRPKEGGTSKYKGVHFHNPTGKWQARIGVDGRRLSLGYHVNEKDAARAYDSKAIALFGKFAWTNKKAFPGEL